MCLIKLQRQQFSFLHPNLLTVLAVMLRRMFHSYEYIAVAKPWHMSWSLDFGWTDYLATSFYMPLQKLSIVPVWASTFGQGSKEDVSNATWSTCTEVQKMYPTYPDVCATKYRRCIGTLTYVQRWYRRRIQRAITSAQRRTETIRTADREGWRPRTLVTPTHPPHPTPQSHTPIPNYSKRKKTQKRWAGFRAVSKNKYLYMYMYMYMYMYLNIYIYIHVYIYVYIYKCIYTYIKEKMRFYIYIYTCIYICTYMYIYVHICIYIYVF